MARSNWEHSPNVATCAACGGQEAIIGVAKGWAFIGGKAYCSKVACREAAALPPEPVEAPDPEWDDEPKRQI